MRKLKELFSNASISFKAAIIHTSIIESLKGGFKNNAPITFHLKGSSFQLKVWQALLQIPFGNVATYSEIASQIAMPRASRAVGSAIGKNPIALLIPCHRVIKSSGLIGEYHWGSCRKTAILGWEAAMIER